MKLSIVLTLLIECTPSPQPPDVRPFVQCLSGPARPWPFIEIVCESVEAEPLQGTVCWYHRMCKQLDWDNDRDVDLADFAAFQRNPGGK